MVPRGPEGGTVSLSGTLEGFNVERILHRDYEKCARCGGFGVVDWQCVPGTCPDNIVSRVVVGEWHVHSDICAECRPDEVAL